MYVDAHLHIADYRDCCSEEGVQEQIAPQTALCCSAHDHTEYERHRLFQQNRVYTGSRHSGDPAAVPFQPLQVDGYGCARSHAGTSALSAQCPPPPILLSFGIHPQNPVTDEAAFFYHLLETKQIHAIGECGFDLFNEAYKSTLPDQQKVWQMQIQWAQIFQLPIVIHCRKALPLIFADTAQLKKLPAVIFHGWGGSPQEAAAFLKKGVNAYFSLGKAVLRGQKSVCSMAAGFDINRLLTETDAPYMRLKAEPFSHPSDIVAVTAQCAHLRNCASAAPRQSGVILQSIVKQYESCTAALTDISIREHIHEDIIEEFANSIADNFTRAFCLR